MAEKRDCQCIECARCLSLLSLALAAEEWHGHRITDAQLHEAVESYAIGWIERKSLGPIHCDYCHKSDVDVLHETGDLPEWGRDAEGCVICDECRAWVLVSEVVKWFESEMTELGLEEMSDDAKRIYRSAKELVERKAATCEST